jgi:tRNA nucleotidyltransferase/poly(A) polymerase
MKINMPKDVVHIIAALSKYGFEAYAVGGCIRDVILGVTPNDWDITTSAKPEDIKAIFKRTVDTGIEHGTVTVLIDSMMYEVTTYRIDGNYSNGRHPDSVNFTSNLEEDLKRRDFTINAMAYNDEQGLVDIFDGKADIEQGIIRCVGEALERFNEDALRMLRAVRFAAQLGFEIDIDTQLAISKLKEKLLLVSMERIQIELTKLLISNNPERIKTLYELGITKLIFKEFDQMMQTVSDNAEHYLTVGEHTIKVLEEIKPDKILRWTALLHDSGKIAADIISTGSDYYSNYIGASEKIAVDLLKKLKMDNNTIIQVKCLIHWNAYPIKSDKICIRQILSKIGEELFDKLLLLMKANSKGKTKEVYEKYLIMLQTIEALYSEIIENGDCFSLKMLAVSGKDLIEYGIKEGKVLGETLEYLLKIVIENPEMNTKEKLLGIL